MRTQSCIEESLRSSPISSESSVITENQIAVIYIVPFCKDGCNHIISNAVNECTAGMLKKMSREQHRRRSQIHREKKGAPVSPFAVTAQKSL